MSKQKKQAITPELPQWSVGSVESERLAERHRIECRFRAYGVAALTIALVFLVILLGTIITKALPAFSATEIALDVTFDPALLELPLEPTSDDLQFASYDALVRDALNKQFPAVTEREDRVALYGLVSKQAALTLRDRVMAHPEVLGTTERHWVLAGTLVDMYRKGRIDRAAEEELRPLKNREIAWIETLKESRQVRSVFHTDFFTEADSREPELAGILGAATGSMFVILVCLALAFPLGVGAAIYLEEFAPKNTLTDWIEININNLAAVPSIIFGLLGLTVYLLLFEFPRSSALVGGLTLALLIMPTLVITTRNALKAVPPSIRQAALAMGATPMQVAFHHTVPLALPGIMTGTILGVARALGETAPLLMIGMVAFVADVPRDMMDPATALPVQVFLWSDSPEMAFVEKTSAAILVLLAFLIALNAVAVTIRNRFERKW